MWLTLFFFEGSIHGAGKLQTTSKILTYEVTLMLLYEIPFYLLTII